MDLYRYICSSVWLDSFLAWQKLWLLTLYANFSSDDSPAGTKQGTSCILGLKQLSEELDELWFSLLLHYKICGFFPHKVTLSAVFIQGGSTIATKEKRFRAAETETPGPGAYNVNRHQENARKAKSAPDITSGKVCSKASWSVCRYVHTGMWVCLCVYMYVCLYCMYVCLYVCMHACMHA